ncbi:5-methylcytosine restriction system specificity protein McrC [Streptococcus parauberis]|uniref:5-methylcytosine restriction system specificity protein McrC n=1 Tax=Streptococcus parauberis TaxID=1348 RepID=UPI000C14F4C9|nr:guanosine 5'-monophosphate oxidoreductase [Streptococcus parauberis]PIA85365.1 5-methylcytosine-specific restriction enzyme subunit McrC [Streptococcus parauberis]
MSKGKTYSSNIVGLLSDSRDEVKIFSRFSKSEKQDYFLRYMFSKVLNFNVTNNELNSSDELSYEKIIIFLFPYYFKNALSKGIYKEYIKRKHNNLNVRGTIDIARHIKNNIPFEGNIAYNTREFSYDNNLTQLIRHTIEFLESCYSFLLDSDSEIREQVLILKRYTSNYSKNSREKILFENKLNPVKHGYFEEYAILQKVCIQILENQKTGFGQDNQKINGLIFDVAWLWEEYIATITKWDHFGRKSHLKTLHMFEHEVEISNRLRYPDYVVGNIPIDTKYKRNLDNRNDLNQIITYMHILKSNQGVFLQPIDIEVENNIKKLGKLTGFGGEISTYKFIIPQGPSNYEEFVSKIKISESHLVSKFLNK